MIRWMPTRRFEEDAFKQDGLYLPQTSGAKPVWNWQPQAKATFGKSNLLGQIQIICQQFCQYTTISRCFTCKVHFPPRARK